MNKNSKTTANEANNIFNRALKNPVSISKGKNRFILMNKDEYIKLKEEIRSLQRNLISMLEVRSGQSETIDNPDKHFEKVFKSTSAKIKKSVQPKKKRH